eukprot:scaffold1061_cov213-Prasinococcus_capsulatus_cf.AAC.1
MFLLLRGQVSTAKMLVECDPEDTELDLSGDAGAVGRLLEGTPQADCGTRRDPFKLDLKGVMYSASIQPCSTMLIVNLTGGGEARVESVFHDFVRLEEDYQQGRTVHHGNLDVNLYSSDSDEVRQQWRKEALFPPFPPFLSAGLK